METNVIHIFGWRIGARTMAAIAELRSSTALGNLGAKNAIYDVVCGVRVDVVPLQGIAPRDLAERLTECGFVTALRPPAVRESTPFAGDNYDAAIRSEIHEAVAVG